MGITFRHDAAGVVPPSNSTTRKYGQQLVLQQQQQAQQTAMQQQQQKYQGYQAGLDRLFYAGRQFNQNQFMLDRDKQQNQFQLDRDKAQNEFAMRQQRAKDFEAARGRMDAYAKDALNNPDLSHELRQKIQNLISGKLTVLGGGFDAPAQQEFLDTYNSQLAALLSEVPPPKPKLTPDEEFGQGIVNHNGVDYRKNSKGDWEPLEQPKTQEPKRFTSADEAFRADPKTRDKYMDDAKEIVTRGDDEPLTEESRKKAADMARKLYEEENGIGTPTTAPALPGSAPAVPGESSILESAPAVQDDAEFHAAMTKKGYKLMTPTDGRSPFYYKDANQPEPDTDFHRSMTAKGYKLMTPTDGTSPYYYRDGAPPSEQPQAKWSTMSLEDKRKYVIDMATSGLGVAYKTINTAAIEKASEAELDAFMQSEAARADSAKKDLASDAKRGVDISNHPFVKFYEKHLGVMNAGAEPPRGAPPAQVPSPTTAAPADTMSANPWKEVAGSKEPAGATQKPESPIGPPDFAKLSKEAKGSDLEELQHMQDVYGALSPEGQKAMDVILSDAASKEQKIEANNALIAMGVNLQEELVKRTVAKSSHPAIPNEFGIY